MIKITVITAVLNGQDCIESTIKSVIGQDYPDVEYIIIDGRSTDKTLEIINTYKEKVTSVFSEPDEGIYDAWNKGLKPATGEWICFIGCGDILVQGALKRYNAFILQHPDLEFVSSKIELVDDKGEIIRYIGFPWKWRHFKKYMNAIHAGALHHKSLFEKYGNFNKEFKIAGDYEFLLRAGEDLRAGFLDSPVVRMKSGGMSTADKKVFDEAEKAKLMHTGRSRISCRVEKYMDILKHYIKILLRKYFNIRYI